jgi:hypothetical protein
MNDKLHQLLADLRLKGMAQTLDQELLLITTQI